MENRQPATSPKWCVGNTTSDFPTIVGDAVHAIHVYEINWGQNFFRSKVLANDGQDNLPSLAEVAENVGVSENIVQLGRFGDAFGSAAFAVVNEERGSLSPIFLAMPDENLPVLVAVDLHSASAEDLARLVRRPRQAQSQMRLLRHGRILEEGSSLADCGVQALDVLQWVEVEEKVMHVIHYQKPDVRKKFQPKVQNFSSVREILTALEESVQESNLRVDRSSHDLCLSVESTFLSDDSYLPHLDVIGVDGSWRSRRVTYKYFTLHVCPRGKPVLNVNLTYKRGCEKTLRERKTALTVPLDSTIQNLRDDAARFVSLKPGHAVKLCDDSGTMLRLSEQEKVSLLPGIANNRCSLYAEPVPAMMLYVDVESIPSGQRISVVEYTYSWSSVADLEKSVASKLETAPGLLCFECKGQEMDKGGILHDYNLKDRSRLLCKFYQRGVVITLKLSCGSWHKILVQDAARTTVGELQRWLEGLTQAPAGLTLVHHGRPLDSDLSLAQAGIALGGRLLVIRPQGVNLMQNVADPYRRIFQVDDQGVHGERFATFHCNGLPFYAPEGTKHDQLHAPPAGDSSAPSKICKDAVQGIVILNTVTPDPRSQEADHSGPLEQREEEEHPAEAETEMISLAASRREERPNTTPACGGDGREVASPSRERGALGESVSMPAPREPCLACAEGNGTAQKSPECAAAEKSQEALLSTFGVDVRPVPITNASQSSGQAALLGGRSVASVEQAQNQGSAFPARPNLLSEAHKSLSSPIPEEGCLNSGTDETSISASEEDVPDNGRIESETPGARPAKCPEREVLAEESPRQGAHDRPDDPKSCSPPYSNPALDAGSAPQDVNASSALLTNTSFEGEEMPAAAGGQDSYREFNYSSQEIMSMSPPNNGGHPDFVIKLSTNQSLMYRSDCPIGRFLSHPPQVPSLGGNNAGPPFSLGAPHLPSIQRAASAPSGVPDQTLKKVAEDLGKDWPKVCLDLGVKSQDIEAINSRHPNDLFSQAFAGLKQWVRAKGSQATLDSLRSCLQQNDLMSIAELI